MHCQNTLNKKWKIKSTNSRGEEILRLKLFIIGVRQSSSRSEFQTADEKACSPDFARVRDVISDKLQYSQVP